MPPPCYWCLSLHPRRPSAPRDRETFPATSGEGNVLIHFQNKPPPLNVFEEISIYFQQKFTLAQERSIILLLNIIPVVGFCQCIIQPRRSLGSINNINR